MINYVFGAIILGVIILLIAGGAKPKMAGNRFLCDRCRYDYDRACNNPNRPNVRRCSEYKARY